MGPSLAAPCAEDMELKAPHALPAEEVLSFYQVTLAEGLSSGQARIHVADARFEKRHVCHNQNPGKGQSQPQIAATAFLILYIVLGRQF